MLNRQLPLLRRVVSIYFSRPWLPATVSIAVLVVAFLAVVVSYSKLISELSYVLAASVVGILASAIVYLVRRRWLQAGISLASLLFVGAAVVVSCIAVFLGPSEDGFADHLTIPQGLKISKPRQEHSQLGWPESAAPAKRDAFQTAIVSALAKPGADDSTITADITALSRLSKHHPETLERYLACNPAWRVFEEHGCKFATRRWYVGPHWHYELHGYYSDSYRGFQTRTTLCLSGKPWARALAGINRVEAGKRGELRLSDRNGPLQSYCLIDDGSLAVEVFEQSNARERRLTKASLSFLQQEFGKLEASPSWATIDRMVAPLLTPPAKPDLILWKSFQPGIYEPEIWANPGEPGMIYLKAFEVTHGTQLSKADLREYSNEWIGWSDNPKQLFVSSTHVTIYEGDWGKPYAARFEVWFVPDSGGPERKLIEKVFRIEGWQR